MTTGTIVRYGQLAIYTEMKSEVVKKWCSLLNLKLQTLNLDQK